jgi:alkylation response protein AidB-like acyl-CoA dehydrogenase
MDFSLSTEREQLRDLTRRLCQTEIAPLVQQAEEIETFPVEIFRRWPRCATGRSSTRCFAASSLRSAEVITSHRP